MIGIKYRLPDDKVINPFSWNTILSRFRRFYSVNHYPKGKSLGTGENLPERFEIRYELEKPQDWENMHENPKNHGVTFDKRGYSRLGKYPV